MVDASKETIYYQDTSVTVSNKRAILGGNTYPVRNITSVSMGNVAPGGTALIMILIIAGLILAFVGFGLAQFGSYLILGVGIALIVAGLAIMVINRPSYAVRIGSASGETNALVSKEKAYIQAVVDALNRAIVEQ